MDAKWNLHPHVSLGSSGQHFPIRLGAVGGHGAHSREPLRAVEPPRGGRGVTGSLSTSRAADQFCEQSLFLVYKLFDFALDEIGTGYACVEANCGRDGVVTLK